MAKWSEIYTEHKGHKYIIAALLEEARFTPSAEAKKKLSGKYPHLQPFNDNLRPARRRKNVLPLAA